MNIQNNIRFQLTEEKIENALISLLKYKDFQNIFVKDICSFANINRSSFYAHYTDINELMMKIENKYFLEIEKIFKNKSKNNDEKLYEMFVFIKEHKEFYIAYIKSEKPSHFEKSSFSTFIDINKRSSKDYENLQGENLIYHMAFFSGGLKAISKVWLLSNCKKSPREMCDLIKNEYKKFL